MNNNLAPTYEKFFGESWVLWYCKSNSYSIVESSFKELLDVYLQSNNLETFKTKLEDYDNGLNTEQLAETFKNYLTESNSASNPSSLKNSTLNKSKRKIIKHYNIEGSIIKVFYDSELVLKTVHPALAHHTVESSDIVKVSFDIYLQNEYLYLFKDEQLITCVPKTDYHLIQGKFIMHLLCSIHNKDEADWLATFHGSTLTDSISSILFIGKSGKGKSTLCALLSSSGFDLLADDVSPMLSQNKNIYYNPSAISIKEGAFAVLKPIVKRFNSFPLIKFNPSKGLLKYIPFNRPEKSHYPCNAVVLVNYKQNSKTIIEKVPIKEALQTLIPDSWLSPSPLHAKQFLDWLETLNTYKLTYSDTNSVNSEVSKLFKQLNKSLY